MSLLYLNIGYANIFHESNFTTIDSFVYNEKNGVSVTNGYGVIHFTETPLMLCGKFDIYSLSNSLDGLKIIIGSTDSESEFNIIVGLSELFYQYLDKKGVSVSYIDFLSESYNLNSLWFYIILDNDNGFIQIALNDKMLISEYNSDIVFGEQSFIKIISNENLYLSNFIFCDQYFESYSEVINCPSIISTDMSSNNQDYIASSTGQSLIHKIDLNNVSGIYGKESEVVGICMPIVYNSPSTIYAKLANVEPQNNSFVVKKVFDLKKSTSGCINYSELFAQKLTLNGLNKKSYGWIVQE